jgi:hypothetical protein
MTNKERAIDFVSRWLRDSSGFHVGLSDGNTEPDYNDLVDRVAALLDARLQDGEPKRDLIDREEAIRELEILKALHLQNAAISDGQSKYAYECYAAATDHCIHNIRALPSVTETERELELERRLRIPFGTLPCAQCGGPHDFDTSIPSELWNHVIRAKGLPEYLCTTCIVREFVRAGTSFTANLMERRISRHSNFGDCAHCYRRSGNSRRF